MRAGFPAPQTNARAAPQLRGRDLNPNAPRKLRLAESPGSDRILVSRRIGAPLIGPRERAHHEYSDRDDTCRRHHSCWVNRPGDDCPCTLQTAHAGKALTKEGRQRCCRPGWNLLTAHPILPSDPRVIGVWVVDCGVTDPLVPALFGVCAASCLSRVRFSALRTSTLHFYRIRASSTRLVPIALNPLVPALFGVCAIIVAVLVSNRNLSSPHFSGYAPSDGA